MNILKLAMLTALVFTLPRAEARQFFKSTYTFSLSRTNADSGIQTFPTTKTADVTVSDDLTYCSIAFGTKKYTCAIDSETMNGSTPLLVKFHFKDYNFFNDLTTAIGAPANLMSTLSNADAVVNQVITLSPTDVSSGNIALNPMDTSIAYGLAYAATSLSTGN